ncbi:hypothetical protein HDU92_008739 [Lobulomyces angularis]|nr:hypothetical protein HDU92_008739 [Lobulomyces angularis]
METTLPSYFPLKLKKCVDPADSFFSCFDTNSIPNGDKEVARKAVNICSKELQAYKKCMEKYLDKSRL